MRLTPANHQPNTNVLPKRSVRFASAPDLPHNPYESWIYEPDDPNWWPKDQLTNLVYYFEGLAQKVLKSPQKLKLNWAEHIDAPFFNPLDQEDSRPRDRAQDWYGFSVGGKEYEFSKVTYSCEGVATGETLVLKNIPPKPKGLIGRWKSFWYMPLALEIQEYNSEGYKRNVALLGNYYGGEVNVPSTESRILPYKTLLHEMREVLLSWETILQKRDRQ